MSVKFDKDNFKASGMSFVDDLARMAGGAANVASTMRQQIQEDIKTRVEEIAQRMDLVPRQDLDDANTRITALTEIVKDLEDRLSALEDTKPKTAAKKTAKKKTTTKKTKKS
ncbi:MAG: accessory factor UbiK family protein [Alphaproteobacteria bacterium]|jgi:BMFP domain-containing protein YqiC|nr:accessory factor UbiK family protein [Alphaproteobacteria bacterium]MDP7222862.1 accessory factor UbiK family protein [Alphaproteobacteria bacterium]